MIIGLKNNIHKIINSTGIIKISIAWRPKILFEFIDTSKLKSAVCKPITINACKVTSATKSIVKRL